MFGKGRLVLAPIMSFWNAFMLFTLCPFAGVDRRV